MLITERDKQRFWCKVRKTAKCWFWTASCDDSGYGQFRFRGTMVGAHRVAWILTFGEIVDVLGVLHKCDNPCCVRPSHLFLGNQRKNVLDMLSKGRQASGVLNGRYTQPESTPRGEDHCRAKLLETDIRRIRRMHRRGCKQAHIAGRFGVSQPLISKILSKQSWRHI